MAARVFRYKSISNAGAYHHTQGLEDGQKRQKESSILSISANMNIVEDMNITCGMNSKQIVVSIGMLPPTPNPVKAVSTRMPL